MGLFDKFGTNNELAGDAPVSYQKIILDRSDIKIRKEFSNAMGYSRISKSTHLPSAVPQRGERVSTMDRSQAFTLKLPVMTDHSSITYSTDKLDLFAKIYTKEALQIDIFENKAKRMVQEEVDIKGVCWPKALLTNSSGDFVGILVPASKGVQLSHSILSGLSGIEQYFPSWDKRDICMTAHTIIDSIYRLHRYGVYYGCLNPASIYIASPTEVYFVDMDNMQIEGYPAISRNVTFTPPELLSYMQKPRLYNRDEENYQVALLTFMLMMPGKYPYAKQKGANDIESIKAKSFPFSVGGEMRRSADAERPSGAWQIIWDHLPYDMCNSFYNTFHVNGKYSRPGTRLKDYEWLSLVDSFYNSLLEKRNSESRALVPETFRRDGKRVFVKCSICGKEHPTFYFLHNLRVQNEKINIWDKGYRVCLPCAVDQSEVSFVCKSCGRRFYYTNRTKIMHEIGRLEFDWKGQKWCHDCKRRPARCSRCGKEFPAYQIKEFHDKKRNQTKSVCGSCFSLLLSEDRQWKDAVFKTVRCSQCGRYFDITNGEREYFEQKGLRLPNRCSSCRRSIKGKR